MEFSEDMTIGDASRAMIEILSPIYGQGEAKAMTRLIFHAFKGWNLTDMVIHSDNKLSIFMSEKINSIMPRLLNHEPIQYILGEAYFYGMNLKVDKSTLIPRQETEQLVDIIVKDNEEADLNVLDIGTGCGAIAIALSRNLKFSNVSAIDISEDALAVAEENSKNLHAPVKFIHADVFTFIPREESLDIIVSNPPYVDESEKEKMDANVLDYEPSSALFVPDDNPLVFYSRITEIATHSLKNGGRLYFEINPKHAEKLASLLKSNGLSDILIIKDIHGKNRFIKCSKR